MIKASQAATQTKIDNAVSALQGADSAATAAEQAKMKVVEDAEKSLATSRSNEKAACQLQQDNKGFAYTAQQKGLGFKCDFSVDGHCAGELGAFKKKLEVIEGE